MMAHGFGATGQHQVRSAVGDIHSSAVQCLHARCAVALHAEGGYFFTAAQPQGNDPGDVGFVRFRGNTAEDDLVQGIGRKRHFQQELPGGEYGQVAGVKRPGWSACLELWCAAAVHHVDRVLLQ